MKILVLRFSSIGDIVLTTPVLRCLRKKYPGAEIHYATKPQFADVLKHNPHITQLHLLSSSLLGFIQQLKNEEFDYLIDLHNNQRTMVIKWLLGIPSFSFPKLNLKKWLLVNFKINQLPQTHIVDRYFETVAQLGVKNDGEGLDYFISKNDALPDHTLPTTFQNGYVAWVVGAKQKTKQFPATKIIETIQQFAAQQLPVALLGGQEDEPTASEIISALPDLSIINLCGKLSLNQSASVVQQSKLVVTNDTGLMHIAAAFKKPTICIWGNTIPDLGMYPYKTPHFNFQVSGLSCRPCSKLGYSECPKKHFNCMNQQNTASLAEQIISLYNA